MPDQLGSGFEHQALEAEIKRLANEIQVNREKPEHQNVPDRELLKRSIQSLGEMSPAPAPSSANAPSPLPDYAQSASAETKLEIEYLLDFAFHHGIDKANAEAKKSNPFVLDAFHDALTGKLYPEFQKRGILE